MILGLIPVYFYKKSFFKKKPNPPQGGDGKPRVSGDWENPVEIAGVP